MNPYSKYDPEDIESLLLHKQFHELYPEEKAFILQHIDTPEEYESLRKTLFELRDAAQEGEWLEPDASLKKDLMAQFVSEEKGSFRVWLNSLFTWPDVQWYRQPALRVAFAGACVVIGVLVFINYNKTEQPTFAENKTEKEKTTLHEADTTQTKKTEEEKNLFAENLTVKEMPSAPTPVNEPSELDKQRHDAARAIGRIADAEDAAEIPLLEELKDADANTAYQPTIMKTQTDKAISREEVTTNSVSVDKAAGNYKNNEITNANKPASALNSRPVSEVNDLLVYLFTAQ